MLICIKRLVTLLQQAIGCLIFPWRIFICIDHGITRHHAVPNETSIAYCDTIHEPEPRPRVWTLVGSVICCITVNNAHFPVAQSDV